MKTLIIAEFMLVASVTAFSQPKTTVKDTSKVKYDYFVKVPMRDYQQLIGIAGDYQKQIKYNQLMKSDDKIGMQINLEKYLFDLPKSVKRDSIIIKK